MRLHEICELKESVTFDVAELVDYPGHGKVFTGQRWWKKVQTECWVCDGTGKDEHHDCEMCHGSGELSGTESEAPELNVSNTNAIAIIEFLGLHWDHSGNFPQKDLPALRRKLIKLKNGGASDLISDNETHQGPMAARQGENGVTTISRGATIHSMGRSADQVGRYAEKLLSIIDFAQKNGAHVTWG